jgi:hypothetical protein
MASSSFTLYKNASDTEVFSLASTVGKVTSYEGAGSTPTFPVGLDFTVDKKPVGNMTNDRMYANLHRSAAATAAGAVRTSSAEMKVSIAKDPTSGATLLAEAVSATCELLSLFGCTINSTVVTNVTKFCAGQLL